VLNSCCMAWLLGLFIARPSAEFYSVAMPLVPRCMVVFTFLMIAEHRRATATDSPPHASPSQAHRSLDAHASPVHLAMQSHVPAAPAIPRSAHCPCPEQRILAHAFSPCVKFARTGKSTDSDHLVVAWPRS
jgi:hypothetical protein